MPRFSLRRILLVTAVFGGVFAIGRFAMREEKWAIAILAGVVALATILAVYALTFGLVVFISGRVDQGKRMLGIAPKTESPFATDKLPPQILPPAEVE